MERGGRGLLLRGRAGNRAPGRCQPRSPPPYARVVDALALPEWARDLVSEARVGHLALLDERRHPRALPVTFVLIGDSVWSAVDEKPKRVAGGELARIRWLRRRPQATLLVDRYAEDWTRLAWVQLIGRVSVLEGVDPPAELIAKYEPYRCRPPTGPLLRLEVERTAQWRAEDPASWKARCRETP
jgi:PPOX class probable F420-dependent enzyme